MSIRAAIPLLIFALLSPGAASAEAGSGAGPREIVGHCQYRDAAADHIGKDAGFALCDSVVIDKGGEEGVLDFREDGRGSSIRYAGKFSGDVLDISSVKVRSKLAKSATGQCQIAYRDGSVSVITCVANVRGVTLAANFVASRINLEY